MQRLTTVFEDQGGDALPLNLQQLIEDQAEVTNALQASLSEERMLTDSIVGRKRVGAPQTQPPPKRQRRASAGKDTENESDDESVRALLAGLTLSSRLKESRSRSLPASELQAAVLKAQAGVSTQGDKPPLSARRLLQKAASLPRGCASSKGPTRTRSSLGLAATAAVGTMEESADDADVDSAAASGASMGPEDVVPALPDVRLQRKMRKATSIPRGMHFTPLDLCGGVPPLPSGGHRVLGGPSRALASSSHDHSPSRSNMSSPHSSRSSRSPISPSVSSGSLTRMTTQKFAARHRRRASEAERLDSTLPGTMMRTRSRSVNCGNQSVFALTAPIPFALECSVVDEVDVAASTDALCASVAHVSLNHSLPFDDPRLAREACIIRDSFVTG